MASSDLRDVLDIPDDHAGPRPSKKLKFSAVRPNLKGLAREVHNLGGDNPIAIVPEVTQFKKRRLAIRKPAERWEQRPFRNSGREDPSLILRHWRRIEQKQGGDVHMDGQDDAEKPAEEIEDSAFAKFNVLISIPQYSDDQYQQVLRNTDWSKEETDYLMMLVRDFELRWPLIWDRYEWTPPATNGEAEADGDESKAIIPAIQARSMEDLKARYYEIASKMMAAQKPVQYMTQPEYALHEVMSHFNPQQEKARKEFAINSLARTPEEFREEESLLLEIKRILARNERFNEERTELYNRLDYPRTETDISAFKSSAGLHTLLQNLMTADKTKKRKSLLGVEAQSPAGQATPQTAVAATEAARRESTAAPGHRESNAGIATPSGGNKKGQPLPERRKLNDHEEAIYGVSHFERLGSGPTFRTEKINKLFSHKSNQQQARITNTLGELDVPAKLAMPTAATTHQYELLLGAVNSLLDARKVMDKVLAEVKVEEAKKDERDKVMGITAPDSGKAEKPTADGANDSSANNEAAEAAVEKDEEPSQPAEENQDDDGSDDDEENEDEKGAEEDIDESQADGTNLDQSEEADQEGEENGEEDEDEDQDEDQDEDEEKAQSEDDEAPPEVEKIARVSRAASHKRSASVLSGVSDKSSKRQKK